MALTTSATSRKPICSFGVSPVAGRPRRLNSSAASIMPGSNSWIGLKCWKSSAVSGLTSPSLFVSGRFGIESLLSFIGLSEADDPADLSAQYVADRVKPPSQRRERYEALLAVHEPVVPRRRWPFATPVRRQARRATLVVWRFLRSCPDRIQTP